MEKKDLKIRKVLTSQEKSKVQQYQHLVIGQSGLWSLVKFELVMLLCSWVPGALGLFLRSKLYPTVLGHVGKGVVFGVNVTLRHPHKIWIGDNVVIDDHCMLDAKGIENKGITVGNNVFIGRNTILSCKDGDIDLEDGVNVGFNCEIYSAYKVRIKANALLAAYSYLVGGSGYDVSRHDVSFAEQVGLDSKGTLEIGAGAWLAAGATVLDGVRVGTGAVIGARALVLENVPDNSIAVGIPAKVTGKRPGTDTPLPEQNEREQ
jgi:acetyltransferase-like isoleucine patch superfamily enzyme